MGSSTSPRCLLGLPCPRLPGWDGGAQEGMGVVRATAWASVRRHRTTAAGQPLPGQPHWPPALLVCFLAGCRSPGALPRTWLPVVNVRRGKVAAELAPVPLQLRCGREPSGISTWVQTPLHHCPGTGTLPEPGPPPLHSAVSSAQRRVAEAQPRRFQHSPARPGPGTVPGDPPHQAQRPSPGTDHPVAPPWTTGTVSLLESWRGQSETRGQQPRGVAWPPARALASLLSILRPGLLPTHQRPTVREALATRRALPPPTSGSAGLPGLP